MEGAGPTSVDLRTLEDDLSGLRFQNLSLLLLLPPPPLAISDAWLSSVCSTCSRAPSVSGLAKDQDGWHRQALQKPDSSTAYVRQQRRRKGA